MTVECAEIETILGPLRKHDARDRNVLSMRWQDTVLNTFFPDRARAWNKLKWHSTHDQPVADWLGNLESRQPFVEAAKVAAFVAFLETLPVLADGHPWSLLAHQCAGVACVHRRFIGLRLHLNEEFQSEFLRIADYWYGKEIGWGTPCLAELIEYRSQLQKLGLDCNSASAYSHLTEAFYPVDLSQAVIDRVCENPFQLESLLGDPKPYGSIEHMAVLLFIAPNSD